MAFKINENKIVVCRCSEQCILNAAMSSLSKNDAEFSGASKNNNFGIRYNNSFFVERSAESWDGNVHDFGITIDRKDVVVRGEVLRKIQSINHPNILRIKNMCNCSVELEYIDGYILNSKKGEWILGPHAYEEDYTDVCSSIDMIELFEKIADAINVLHQNGVCHTDTTNHNIMVEKVSNKPVLIDLIGAMPYSDEFAILDKKIFLKDVVINMSLRKGIKLPLEIKRFSEKKGDYNLYGLQKLIKEMLMK